MTDRLISADALKREMWRRCGETDIEIDKGRAKWDSGLWIRYKVFEECIADAPTIEAEPIVRCKDCRYYCPNLIDEVTGLPMCGAWAAPQKPEGYCTYGAIKDEVEE